MQDLILLFTIGGFSVSILAGTTFARDPRLWWPMALFVAVAGALLNTWDDLRVERLAAPTGLMDYAWPVCVYAFGTLFVAGVARVGCKIRLPGIVRAVACLVTDLFVRWGGADAVFILFCTLGTCDV